MKLQPSPTSLVPIFEFNPAEATSAWSQQGGGQAQQKPNLEKAPMVVEVEYKENPAQGK